MESLLRVNKLDNFIFFLFASTMVVDTIHGLSNFMGLEAPLSLAFKLFLVLVLIIRCKRNAKILRFILCVVFYLFIYVLHILLIEEDLADTIVAVSKPITSLLFFVYFIEVKRSNPAYFESKAFYVLKWSAIVFLFNLILGALGIGIKSYNTADGAGIGGSGFLNSGNEVSGVIATIFPWILYYCKNKFLLIKYCFCGVFLFYGAYTLGTKSGMAATLLFFFYIMYFYGNKKEKFIVAVSCVIALITGGVIIQYILSSDLPVVQRFTYFMDKTDILTALTSNRLNFWDERSKEFYDAGLFTHLLGLGGNRTVEMDPYDAILNCGYVGLIFIIIIYLKLILNPLKRIYKVVPYRRVILISNVMLFVISIGGGHILFSSMAGLLIALSNAMLFGNTIKIYK